MLESSPLAPSDRAPGGPLPWPPGIMLPPDLPAEVAIPGLASIPSGTPTLRAALRGRSLGVLMTVAWQLLRARLQLRQGIRRGQWVRVRGRVRVQNEGSIVIGDRVRFRAEAADCELVTWAGGQIEIGAGTTINFGTSISAAARVSIGRDCLIGTYVNIMDCTFHNVEDHSWQLDGAPITIGDRVWLGNRCMIMKGVTIGDGAVVAGCSLVTRDVPAHSMVVGVPARVVKNL